jgi:hypothetical protein
MVFVWNPTFFVRHPTGFACRLDVFVGHFRIDV